MEDLAEAVRKAVRREHDKLDAVLAADVEARKAAMADEAALREAARAAGAAIEELGSGDDYGLWKLDLPVLRWYCREALKDVCGRPRDMGDVAACVRLVREFVRCERGKDFGRRLAELAQSRYGALTAGGMRPDDARRTVGEGVYGRRMARRDLVRLSDEENRLLWKAAKEMAFPPNYVKEAQAWIGALGGPAPAWKLKGTRTFRDRDGSWTLVPSSRPELREPAEKRGP